jgi:internalin A
MSRLMPGCAILWLALASPAARADEAEDNAVAFVKELGGKTTRDEKAAGRPITTVTLDFTEVTDAGLKELAALKNLTKLDIGNTEVTLTEFPGVFALSHDTK